MCPDSVVFTIWLEIPGLLVLVRMQGLLIGHWTEPVGEMFVIVTWLMLTETAPRFVTVMLNPWAVKFRAPG